MAFAAMFRRPVVMAAGMALACGLVAAPAVASAASRVALVVGNSTYAAIGRLPNPANDAADVAAALGRLGFDVTTVRDADRAALTDALRAFSRESAGADVALVFYAGHGLEMDGVNYLVPVDARFEWDTDVRFEAIELDYVLAATEGAGLRVVILDACRNNPLARSMQRTSARRSVSRGSFGNLDESLLGNETLVAYAAAAGTTAADGTGRNSPYTAALLAYLEQPLEIGLLFREVRARVLEATGGEQRPHEYASLLGEHYLRPATADAVSPAGAAAEATRAEVVFWESIRESANAADFDAYLARWPTGIYAPLATNRLSALGDRAAVARTRRESGDVFRDCPACPALVVVPAGTFPMGSDRRDDESDDDERPRHRVAVGSFALGVHEVTLDEYAVFVEATGRAGNQCWAFDAGDESWDWRAEASWRSPGYSQAGDHPVVCVSWQDAQAYVRWLRTETGEEYRLPSESEWEYAARAGTATRRHWGNGSDDQCAYANGADGTAKRRFTDWTVADCVDGALWTSPVGALGANGFGLHDMLGNVWEWVADCWHADYDGAPLDGTAWTGDDCDRRVLRGGSWYNTPRFLRAATRDWDVPGLRFSYVGFRVARTLGAP